MTDKLAVYRIYAWIAGPDGKPEPGKGTLEDAAVTRAEVRAKVSDLKSQGLQVEVTRLDGKPMDEG